MTTVDFPFAHLRARFPILSRRAQLSSCSQSALSLPVAEALQGYLEGWQEEGMCWEAWGQGLDAAKREFARLIGADAADIAALSCVSDLASSVAGSLDFSAEKNGVVLGETDFPSVGHVWLAQQARGAQVRFAGADGDECIAPERFEQIVDERTRLVCVSQVTYATSYRHDIAALARIAHARGALLFVDAYQSAGALAIDVKRDEVDFLACGAQKFLLGTPGVAFLYVRPGLAESLRPLATGWFGRVNPFAFDIRGLDYAAGARRFETGTPPYLVAAAARAGIAMINELGPQPIERYLAHLSEVACEAAHRNGLVLATPADPARRGAHVAVRIANAAELERRMAAAGYIVSARGPCIRVAPHFYNTEAEVAGAMAALARLG